MRGLPFRLSLQALATRIRPSQTSDGSEVSSPPVSPVFFERALHWNLVRFGNFVPFGRALALYPRRGLSGSAGDAFGCSGLGSSVAQFDGAVFIARSSLRTVESAMVLAVVRVNLG